MESKREILIVIFVLLLVCSPIIGFCIGTNIPSSYKIICVEFKFIKNGNYYIIGETTSKQKMGTLDIYLVDPDDYSKFTEGMEYSISTKGNNNWSRFYKKICDFKQMIYD